jgi:hypothetical protein
MDTITSAHFLSYFVANLLLQICKVEFNILRSTP